MILTAHQPTYMPWLGLFNKISFADCFVLFDTVQYLPKEWMNRNKIKTSSGETFITVPVLKKGYLNNKMNKDIQIDNTRNWKRKHAKSIYLNYKNTYYFDNYFPFFENLYKQDWNYLSELNFYILENLLKFLNINIKILKLSELNIEGKKSDLVLNMCKKLNAKTYIFGSQGENYANKNQFKIKNINLVFQNYKHPVYNQQSGEFIPNLSVIDLLFNHGNDSLGIINFNNSLIK
jgi:hypothetical protein